MFGEIAPDKARFGPEDLEIQHESRCLLKGALYYGKRISMSGFFQR